MELTLAQALKLKNKLAAKMNKQSTDIQRYNVVVADREAPVNVKTTLEDRGILATRLIELKTEINKANLPIQSKIYELAELKGLMVILNNLRNGTHDPYGYRNEEIEYTTVFPISDVDTIMDGVQDRIDNIQEELDNFNYNTKITVSFTV